MLIIVGGSMSNQNPPSYQQGFADSPKKASGNAIYFFVIVMTILFVVFLYLFSARQQDTLMQIRTEMSNLTSAKKQELVAVDKQGDVIKRKVDKSDDSKIVEQRVNIPLEVLKEVKYFNETLNQRQNETLQLILYVVAFISIVATFFGYKTIKDIRDAAESESKKITTQYENSFTLLNELNGIYKADIVGAKTKIDDSIASMDRIKNEVNNTNSTLNIALKELNDKLSEDSTIVDELTKKINDIEMENYKLKYEIDAIKKVREH